MTRASGRSRRGFLLGALVAAVAAGVALLVILVVQGRGSLPEPIGSGPSVSFAALTDGTEVLIGTGDIARCDGGGDEATAAMLDGLEGTIFTTGDNVYPDGTAEDFARCYEPTWGRHKERTQLPAAGNHEWLTDGAAGYVGYFGEAAAPEGTTWYARTVGSWRVIVLDSACEQVGGCDEGSVQFEWLQTELADNPTDCTVAIWHEPRWSSGWHGGEDGSKAFWRALHDAGAEIILNGHEHSYERFAPLDADGEPDPERGIRQFVIGTGGGELRGFDAPLTTSEARIQGTYGLLRLELAEGEYGWQFLPTSAAQTDTGSGTCH